MSQAFQALFRAHAPFVWRVLRRHGVAERELEDAAQEVFMVVHRKLAEFDGRAAMRTWIYGIAVRVARDGRRRAHVRRERLGHELTEPSVSEVAFEHTARRQLLALAERALAQMSEDKREVFALYELDQLTMAEVAESLGIPESTALSRLYAAREEIQRHVRAHQGQEQRRAYAERAASEEKARSR